MMSIRCAFAGDAGVGKTSIIYRYSDNTFSSQSIETTLASGKKTIIDIRGKKVQLSISDTAGQERYRSLIPIHFVNQQIMFLVYDITKKKSFDDLSEFFEKASDICGNSIIAIVGNKSDLAENKEVFADEVKEIIRSFKDSKRIRRLQHADEIYDFVTSAKDGSGVQEMFEMCVSRALELGMKPEEGQKLTDAKAAGENKCC